jgi:hypothetical protein
VKRFRFISGFLRMLIGLSDRTSPYWGIDRSPMSDIDRARWRKSAGLSATGDRWTR